jgi:hypothetical protein
MVIVLTAFIEHCVSLVHGHPSECSWIEVSQTDVFHLFLPSRCSYRPGEGQQHSFSGIPEVAQNSKIPPELHEHLVIADRGAAISDLIRAIQREL